VTPVVQMARSRLITPCLTLDLPLSEAQRSGPITAEVGGSSPPRPTIDRGSERRFDRVQFENRQIGTLGRRKPALG
jgi:hypothetical protein